MLVVIKQLYIRAWRAFLRFSERVNRKLRHGVGEKGERGGEKVVGEIADRAIIPGPKSVDERQLGA